MSTINRFNTIIEEDNGIITSGKMVLLIEELAENGKYDDITYGIGLLQNFRDGRDVQRAYDKVVDIAITNGDFDVAENYNANITNDEVREWYEEIIDEKRGE